jgi:hypothetical protein
MLSEELLNSGEINLVQLRNEIDDFRGLVLEGLFKKTNKQDINYTLDNLAKLNKDIDKKSLLNLYNEFDRIF